MTAVRTHAWLMVLVSLLAHAPFPSMGVCDDRYGVTAGSVRPLAQWSLTEVTQWLGRTLRLPWHEDLFSTNGIDGAMLHHWRLTTAAANTSWGAAMDATLHHLGGYKRGVTRASERQRIAAAVEDLVFLEELRQQARPHRSRHLPWLRRYPMGAMEPTAHCAPPT